MKYTAYFGIKYHGDNSNKDLIETIAANLETVGIEIVCIARDIEKWGKVQFTPHELMKITCDQIDSSDFVVLEMSEKGIGLGIEAGYAVAKNKILLVLIKEGYELSTTMQGITNGVIYYDRIENIGKNLLSKLESSGKPFNIRKAKQR